MGESYIQSANGLKVLEQVREISMRLPEVTEAVDKFGHTSFRVNDKPFVMMGEHGEEVGLSIKTLLTTQEVLLQKGGYTKTAYIGHHGWVSLVSAAEANWQEVEELILEGYLRSAPKRLQKLVLQ